MVIAVVIVVMLSCLSQGSVAGQETQGGADAESVVAESLDLTLTDTGARLGDRVLRHPVREADLVALLGPPERARYRVRWLGRGVLAVPADREGELEELVFVLCEGAPEAARVGVFPGTVRLDGRKLSCDATREEVLAALPEDFHDTEELDALVHARRGALELIVSLSSWDGLLSLSLGFPDPDDLEPLQPEVRSGDEPNAD